MNHLLARPLLVAVVTASCALAYAANTAKMNDAVADTHVGVSLTQAIGVAEQHVGGTASRAQLEQSRQGPVYEVEIVQGSKAFDVKVDANKGQVVSSAEDKADGEEEGDD